MNISRKNKTGIERCRIKNKPKKMDLIFRGICIYWVTFVIVAWITYWVKDAVPDSLIQFGLGGGTLELVMSAIIEIARDTRERKREKEEEE